MALEWLGPVLGSALIAYLVRSSNRRERERKAKAQDESAKPADRPLTTLEDFEKAALARADEPPSMDLAVLLHRLAHALSDQGRPVDAERHASRLGEMVRDLPETSPTDLMATWEHHAALLCRLGRLAEAERVQTQVAELADRFYDAQSIEAIRQRVTLAAIHLNRGRTREALESLRSALESCLQIDSSDVPARAPLQSQVLRQIASCFLAHGDPATAERALRTAHEIDRSLLGDTNAELAASYEALAVVSRLQGRAQDALNLLEQALAVLDRAPRPADAVRSETIQSLGELLRDQGRLDAAEARLVESLAIDERRFGADHLELVPLLGKIAGLQRLRGRSADAESALRRRLAILERSVGREHRELIGSLSDLAHVLEERGRSAEADVLFLRALDIARRVGPETPVYVELVDQRARLAQNGGRGEEADSLLAEALEWRERALSEDHPELAFRLLALAGVRCSLGRPDDAEALYARSLAIFTRRFGQRHRTLIDPLYALSTLRFQRGDLEGAQRDLERCLELAEADLGESHPALLYFVESQAALLDRLGRSVEAEHMRSRARLLREARGRITTVIN